jgi:hypothetical protein
LVFTKDFWSREKLGAGLLEVELLVMHVVDMAHPIDEALVEEAEGEDRARDESIAPLLEDH